MQRANTLANLARDIDQVRVDVYGLASTTESQLNSPGGSVSSDINEANRMIRDRLEAADRSAGNVVNYVGDYTTSSGAAISRRGIQDLLNITWDGTSPVMFTHSDIDTMLDDANRAPQDPALWDDIRILIARKVLEGLTSVRNLAAAGPVALARQIARNREAQISRIPQRTPSRYSPRQPTEPAHAPAAPSPSPEQRYSPGQPSVPTYAPAAVSPQQQGRYGSPVSARTPVRARTSAPTFVPALTPPQRRPNEFAQTFVPGQPSAGPNMFGTPAAGTLPQRPVAEYFTSQQPAVSPPRTRPEEPALVSAGEASVPVAPTFAAIQQMLSSASSSQLRTPPSQPRVSLPFVPRPPAGQAPTFSSTMGRATTVPPISTPAPLPTTQPPPTFPTGGVALGGPPPATLQEIRQRRLEMLSRPTEQTGTKRSTPETPLETQPQIRESFLPPPTTTSAGTPEGPHGPNPQPPGPSGQGAGAITVVGASQYSSPDDIKAVVDVDSQALYSWKPSLSGDGGTYEPVLLNTLSERFTRTATITILGATIQNNIQQLDRISTAAAKKLSNMWREVMRNPHGANVPVSVIRFAGDDPSWANPTDHGSVETWEKFFTVGPYPSPTHANQALQWYNRFLHGRPSSTSGGEEEQLEKVYLSQSQQCCPGQPSLEMSLIRSGSSITLVVAMPWDPSSYQSVYLAYCNAVGLPDDPKSRKQFVRTLAPFYLFAWNRAIGLHLTYSSEWLLDNSPLYWVPRAAINVFCPPGSQALQRCSGVTVAAYDIPVDTDTTVMQRGLLEDLNSISFVAVHGPTVATRVGDMRDQVQGLIDREDPGLARADVRVHTITPGGLEPSVIITLQPLVREAIRPQLSDWERTIARLSKQYNLKVEQTLLFPPSIGYYD